MQLYPGVHQIQSDFGGRNLFQYLFVGERTLLLDTGAATTPEKVIFPYMEKLGLDPRRLTLAITMHADLDHQGGNSSLRAASRDILLACHREDRELIEDPEMLYRRRYDHLRATCGMGLPHDGMDLAGRPVSMDILVSGGEILRLGDGWDLHVWHVPGHSDGHLTIYDPRQRSAFTSDTIHGRGCPKADGTMAFGPTYYTVDAYLATIHFLEQMPIEHLYSGHWPNAHGPGVKRFLSESRRFVETVDEVLPDVLDRHPKGATLSEIVADLSERLGDWPAGGNALLQWAVYGHLMRQEQRGKIVRVRDSQPWRWRRAEQAAPRAITA
jgi:glyoxylase-like metal-dependent hydrolase (beta-lactamase superfamily II)